MTLHASVLRQMWQVVTFQYALYYYCIFSRTEKAAKHPLVLSPR